MVFAADFPTILGIVATALGSLAGAYAVVQSKKTESRSATREETKQVLDAQNALLNRYEARISKLETDNNTLHVRVNDALGKAAEAKAQERQCVERLTNAEARLRELERLGHNDT